MRHELATGLMLTGAVVWAVWIVGMVYGMVASVRAGMRARECRMWAQTHRSRRPAPPSRPGLRMVNGGRR